MGLSSDHALPSSLLALKFLVASTCPPASPPLSQNVSTINLTTFTFPHPLYSVLHLLRSLLTPFQLHSTILTLMSSLLQLAALLWYAISYFPMGGTGLRFAARVGAGRATAWMND